MNTEAKVVVAIIVAFLFLVITTRLIRFMLESYGGKPKPEVIAKVPSVYVDNNSICDMKVGEKGVICCDVALFVDREYQCWIDTRWDTKPEWASADFEGPNMSSLGAAEVTRTETGYVVKLLTLDYKLRVRHSGTYGGDRFVKPVEKFEVREDT